MAGRRNLSGYSFFSEQLYWAECTPIQKLPSCLLHLQVINPRAYFNINGKRSRTLQPRGDSQYAKTAKKDCWNKSKVVSKDVARLHGLVV